MSEILFLGKDKPAVREALEYLHNDPATHVVGVVAVNDAMADYSKHLGIPTLSHDEAHQRPWNDIDLAVSYLYPKMIREPLISGPKLGAINFHPAPLPKYRGVAPYSRAILEGDDTYGVSAHYVDKDFDTGDLIAVDKFTIDPKTTTAQLLEKQASDKMFALFKNIMGRVKRGRPLPRLQQSSGESIYTAKADLDRLREVHLDDDPETVSRKIRAFFFPPHDGAFVKIDGKEIALRDSQHLAEIAKQHDVQ